MKKIRIALLMVCIILAVSLLAACNHEHHYVDEVIEEATCTEDGVIESVCSICGNSKGKETVPALGHAYDLDEDENKVWLTSDSKHWHECTRCGLKEEEGTHSYNAENVCSVCGFMMFSFKETEGGYILTSFEGATDVVTVPSTYDGKAVVAIGESAFASKTNKISHITEITIPSSIKRIERNAFSGCNDLTKVHAESLEAWLGIKFDNNFANPAAGGAELYFGAAKAEGTITIPDGVVSIGNYAFYGLGTLTGVHIQGSNLTSIGYRAFEGAFKEGESNIQISVDSIAAWCAIDFCPDAHDVYACSANPLSLGAKLVAGGSEVKDTLDLAGVSKIGSYAFYGYGAITQVNLTSAVTEVGRYAFANCKNITSVSIDGIDTVPASLFEGCEKIDSITLSGVEEIGARAFYNCPLVSEVALPSGLTSVGSQAFAACSALASVTGGEDLVNVGYYAFDDTALFDLAEGVTQAAPVYVAHVLIGIKGNINVLNDPLSKLEVQAGTVVIADGALANIANLRQIVLPSSLLYIGDSAFRNTSSSASLNEVTFGGSEKSIGAYAFAGNTALTYIAIPASVESIGEHAFTGCTRLADVYAQSLESWCGITFANAQANPLNVAHRLHIGEYDPDIKPAVLTELVIPDGVEKISAYAFTGLSNVSYVVLPSSVTEIGDGAFANCNLLSAIYYDGEEEAFGDVTIGENAYVATVYHFKAEAPQTPGNYWHYDANDKPVRW